MVSATPEYSLFDQHHGDDTTPDSVMAIVRELEQTERDQLANDLARINEQLDQRDRLHTDLLDDLQWKRDRYREQLQTLYRHGRGKTDGTRDRVKSRIADLEQAIRRERREHWQDRQQLEWERRDVLRDLAALNMDRLSEVLY